MAASANAPRKPTLQELLDEITWEDIVADGITTIEEIEEMMRAKGVDPYEFDDLYDD